MGPAWAPRNNRFIITLTPMRGTKLRPKILPYGRYVYMAVHGVKLSSSLQVDHIDGDRTHDVRENLQILTAAENRLKSQVERRSMGTTAEMVCPQCRGLFFRAKRQTHMAKKGEFTACSRKCAGKFRKRLQDANTKGDTKELEKLKKLLVGNFLKWSLNENPTGKILVEAKMVGEPWENVSTPLEEIPVGPQ